MDEFLPLLILPDNYWTILIMHKIEKLKHFSYFLLCEFDESNVMLE